MDDTGREPPWADIEAALEMTAADIASIYSQTAAQVAQLDLQGRALVKESQAILHATTKAIGAQVAARAEAMMSDARIAPLVEQIVDAVERDAVLWAEAVYENQHTDGLGFARLEALQRDMGKADRFDPAGRRLSAWEISPLQRLPRAAELIQTFESVLATRLTQGFAEAPPSRVPQDEALRAVYVEAIRLVWVLVETHLHEPKYSQQAGETLYSHVFISAGERAFAILARLGAMEGLSGKTRRGRHTFIAEPGRFVAERREIEALVEAHGDTAPGLGDVLCAVSYMSAQYGHGFDLERLPGKLSREAFRFVTLAQEAGLAAKVGPDRAIWRPLCPPQVAALYRETDIPNRWEDDAMSDAQKLAALLRVECADEIAKLGESATLPGFLARVIEPWRKSSPYAKHLAFLPRAMQPKMHDFFAEVILELGLETKPAKGPLNFTRPNSP